MGRRRKAREIVLQSLYESEFSDKPWPQILEEQTERRSSGEDTVNYARRLLEVVVAKTDQLDMEIRGAAQNWEIERISIVDKNILRFALAEIMFFPEVPARVVINEAIEIAHKYSSGDAGKFVNGILDRLAQKHRQEDA